MESLASVVGSHKGETIEVVTNAGQRLGGIVKEAYEDFFTVSSITHAYVIPYSGVSTIQFPSDRPQRYVKSSGVATPSTSTGATRTRRRPVERKRGRAER